MTAKHTILMMIILSFLASSVSAMPPSPELYEELKQSNRLHIIEEAYQQMYEYGANVPFEFNRELVRRDDGDDTELKVICLLADFDDQVADTARYGRDDFQSMLFSEDEYETGSMRDWFLENSYDEVNIVGEVFGWYRLENDYEYYVDSARGFGNFPRNAAGLTRDLLLAADDDVDFSEYDNDGDGVVEGLFTVHAGRGAESTGSYEMIWSHAANVQPRGLRLDGVTFDRYAMEPEDGRIGVFGHELGHSMFGLPDLYDTSYESRGIGNWSMMSGGSWGGGGRRPVHFDAWCKMRVGFLQPFTAVRNEEGVELGPIERVDDVIIAWKHGEWTRQFYMLENRRQIGFDVSIPAEGLLIWHIDENMNSNANAWWPEQGGQRHNIVALEQADGNYDLEKDQNSGDRGDPFPGSRGNTYFGYETEPSSRDYAMRNTEVQVYNIEFAEDNMMRFDIAVIEGAGPEALSLFVLTRIPEDHEYPHPDDPDQEEMTDEITLVTEMLFNIGADIDAISDTLPEDLSDYNVVLYLESWRDEDYPDHRLSLNEEVKLAEFLDNDGKLLMIGPEIGTHLQEENLLWDYLHAEYESAGLPADSGNMRFLRNNGENDSYIGAMTFPFRQGGPCDHYPDVIGPDSTAQLLFEDQNGTPRGSIAIDESGYRIALQPFNFGGLRDWGGSKELLLDRYFRHFQFYLERQSVDKTNFSAPVSHSLLVAFPNPFNYELKVSFPTRNSITEVTIFDVNGRLVDVLGIDSKSNFGIWKPDGLPSGNYWLSPVGVKHESVIGVTYLK